MQITMVWLVRAYREESFATLLTPIKTTCRVYQSTYQPQSEHQSDERIGDRKCPAQINQIELILRRQVVLYFLGSKSRALVAIAFWLN